MKIVIIGAGISGLTSYLFFRKHLLSKTTPAVPHTIVIYEAHNANLNSNTSNGKDQQEQDAAATVLPSQEANSMTVGGALAVGPNGLNVLRRLDEELFKDVTKMGHPITSWRMSNRWGWELTNVQIKTKMDDGKDMGSIMIGRQDFWKCLRAKVDSGAILKRKVKAVIVRDGGEGCLVTFEDGDAEYADLVVGADGLWSVARKSFLADEQDQAWDPIYEGYVGVGGFLPARILKECNVKDGEMNMVLGNNAFFGYGYTTSAVTSTDNHHADRVVAAGDVGHWWATYQQSECPDWKQKPDSGQVVSMIQELYGRWNQPNIHKILEKVDVEVLYPTWSGPVLPTWTKGGLVLIGDAAHAMIPSSGQGACLAVEDAEVLGLFLEQALKKGYESSLDGENERHIEREAIALATKRYVDLRKPRISRIYERSRMFANTKGVLPLWKELCMSAIIWIITHLRLNLDKDYQEALNGWNGEDEVRNFLQKLENESNENEG